MKLSSINSAYPQRVQRNQQFKMNFIPNLKRSTLAAMLFAGSLLPTYSAKAAYTEKPQFATTGVQCFDVEPIDNLPKKDKLVALAMSALAFILLGINLYAQKAEDKAFNSEVDETDNQLKE